MVMEDMCSQKTSGYRSKPANQYRWSWKTGGHKKTGGHRRQFVIEDQWIQPASQPSQVTMEDRCSQKTGVHKKQVVTEDRCSQKTGGHRRQVFTEDKQFLVI